ncbi:hypothetical protein GCM10017559_38220 [Streptosporangium longisporum]|uniref:Alanine racemase N-terminal domain-containing protein n=1 Tax=Streptosporangium longisporum TaxID=46187 RepID=A0ABN3Y3G9_9ACTN
MRSVTPGTGDEHPAAPAGADGDGSADRPAPAGADATPATRRDEIAAGLARVEAEIAEACRAAGRHREELTLVAVSKTYPASDVRLLAGLGITDVGENRDQEASAKARDCADLGLRWHFIGQLQTNKARSVAATPTSSIGRPSAPGHRAQPGGARGGTPDHTAWCRWPWTGTRQGRRAAREVEALADAVAGAGGLALAG